MTSPRCSCEDQTSFPLAQDQPTHILEEESEPLDRVEPAPRSARAPIDFVNVPSDAASLLSKRLPTHSAPVDPMNAILKALDKAMVEIPTLRRE